MIYTVRKITATDGACVDDYGRAMRLYVSLARTHPEHQFCIIRENGQPWSNEELEFQKWLTGSEVRLGDITTASIPTLWEVCHHGAVAAINVWAVMDYYSSEHDYTLARLAGTCMDETYYLPSGKQS